MYIFCTKVRFSFVFLLGKICFTKCNVNIHLFTKLFITRRIILFFLCNYTYSFSVQLNNEKLNKIADRIISLFPAECKEVYYCPPVKKKDSRNQKSGNAKGKQVDKNRNMLAFLRKCQLIPLSKSFSTNNFEDEDNSDES